MSSTQAGESLITSRGMFPNRVDVWAIDTIRFRTPLLLDACRRLLSEGEMERMERYVFEEHRDRFILRHALLRSVLSRYAEVKPEDWEIEEGSYGRPEILRPLQTPVIRFNLSHTSGMAVCAVTLDRELGVDVERTGRGVEASALAQRFFAPSEVAGLRAEPTEGVEERFATIWTLKEAYLKARGVGLSIPLDHFAFELDQAEAPTISFTPELDDDENRWQFICFRPTERHHVAVAVERTQPTIDAEVRLRWTTPLGL